MDIEYSRFGEILVAGELFDRDLVVEKGRVRRRKKGPSKRFRNRFGHTPLSIDEEIPWSASRLIIGTGAEGRLPVMTEVHELAATKGVEVIELKTAEACRLLRTLENEEINAILHVTC